MSGLFSLEGRVAVVTGGSGAIGSALAKGLADAGARVAVLARNPEKLEAAAAGIPGALAVPADVLDRPSLEQACATVVQAWGRVDVLVNGAGGNLPEATLPPDGTVLDLSPEGVAKVVDLNLIGTLLPITVFGPALADRLAGSGGRAILNISSMTAQRALTRVGGYGAAKAAVESLTRWLAVETARTLGPELRVNAIAPGFVVGDQNRALLVREDGTLTERGAAIVARTPAGRLQAPEDLVGAAVWLCSPASALVTGVVVAVDGGFSAWSGV